MAFTIPTKKNKPIDYNKLLDLKQALESSGATSVFVKPWSFCGQPYAQLQFRFNERYYAGDVSEKYLDTYGADSAVKNTFKKLKIGDYEQ